jgi:uncharacterized protein (DUF1697 family)
MPVVAVAFLKGVNLGRRRVTMPALCAAFDGLGLGPVTTFIASGNVIFDRHGGEDTADLEARMSVHLAGRLGWPVEVFVRSTDEIRALAGVASVAGGRPGAGDTLQIGLFHRPPDGAGRAALVALATPTDLMEVDGRELRWLRRGPVHLSRVTTARVERAGGGPVTFRSVTTLAKLLQVLPSDA